MNLLNDFSLFILYFFLLNRKMHKYLTYICRRTKDYFLSPAIKLFSQKII